MIEAFIYYGPWSMPVNPNYERTVSITGDKVAKELSEKLDHAVTVGNGQEGLFP